VYVVARGVIGLPLGQELIKEARTEAARLKFNILCDVRQSTAKVTLADWFFLPRTLDVYLKTKTRYVRTAIVVNAGRQEYAYNFFRTAAVNLGLSINVFLDEQDALQWLEEADGNE